MVNPGQRLSLPAEPDLDVLIASPRLASRARLWLLALLLVGTACPGPDVGHYREPRLVNRTGAPADVSITWILRQVTCNESLTAVAGTLTGQDLGDGVSMTLTSGSVAALDFPPLPGSSGQGACRSRDYPDTSWGADCALVLLESKGGPTALVRVRLGYDESAKTFASDGTLLTCPTQVAADADPGNGALSLAIVDGAQKFVPSAAIEVVPASRAEIEARATTIGCRAIVDQYRQLVGSGQACSSDGDCRAVLAPPVPDQQGKCSVYVSAGAPVTEVAKLVEEWNGTCRSFSSPYCSAFIDAAVCRHGRCEAQ